MARWVADTTEWPIVVLSVPAGTDPKDIDQESFYEEASALIARGERFASVVDLRLRAPLDAARRRRFVDWARSNTPALRGLQIASATVVETTLQQGLLSAILWLVKPPSNAKSFKTVDDARVWLRQQLVHDRDKRRPSPSV